MHLNTELMYQSLPLLLRGAWVSIQVAMLSAMLGFILGTILGFLHSRKNNFLRIPITLYVGVIRGTPMLIQITFFYYVLPAIGIALPAYWAAILAIGINSGAYLSQTIKAGILAVGNDQVEAARVLGLTIIQTAWHITIPQAFRIVLPSLTGECVTLIKDSSLASVIGVMELYKESRAIMNHSYEVITVFCLVALFYLVMTSTIELVGKLLERKMNWYVKH